MNYFRYNNILYDDDGKQFSGINFRIPNLQELESNFILYQITEKTQYRPDIIAYEIYGNGDLSWIIDETNNVTHPSFYEKGIKIKILPGNYLTSLGIL